MTCWGPLGMRSDTTLMTSAEVAQVLRVSEKTLSNWRYRGQIPYLRVGGLVRYRWSDIDAWLKRQQSA